MELRLNRPEDKLLHYHGFDKGCKYWPFIFQFSLVARAEKQLIEATCEVWRILACMASLDTRT